MEGYLRLGFGGLIFKRAYFWEGFIIGILRSLKSPLPEVNNSSSNVNTSLINCNLANENVRVEIEADLDSEMTCATFKIE